MTTLTVKPLRTEDTIQHGLRVEWLSGSDEEGLTFDLTAGAGVGSPYLILTVTEGDRTIREVVDMRTVVHDWVDQVRSS